MILNYKRGGFEEIKKLLFNAIKESPKPEDLYPGAVDLIVNAIKNEQPFYIWTAGKLGSFTLPDGREYEECNNQQLKIDGSALLPSVDRALRGDLGNLDDAQAQREKLLHIKIGDNGKEEEFKELLTENEAQLEDDTKGIDVFVADDREFNLIQAQKITEAHPKVRLHPFQIKNNEPGFADIQAYHRYVEQYRQKNPNAKIAHIVDLDDTLFNELQRVRRIAEIARDHLYPTPIASDTV